MPYVSTNDAKILLEDAANTHMFGIILALKKFGCVKAYRNFRNRLATEGILYSNHRVWLSIDNMELFSKLCIVLGELQMDLNMKSGDILKRVERKRVKSYVNSAQLIMEECHWRSSNNEFTFFHSGKLVAANDKAKDLLKD